MKRTRRIEKGNKLLPPFVPELGIYKNQLVEIVREKNEKGMCKVNDLETHEVAEVNSGKVTRISRGSRWKKMWDFVYTRKWFVENHYDQQRKDSVLFELNLYLKEVEKEIVYEYLKS
jgi:hypothetical protein